MELELLDGAGAVSGGMVLALEIDGSGESKVLAPTTVLSSSN